MFHEQDFEVSVIESQRARKNISCDVQLRTTIYMYVYVSQEWEAFVDLPTFIQYLFRLDKQRNIFENCTHASNVNVWYKREFSKLFSSSWLFIYIMFNLLFVEKVDYRLDFYKNISDSPEDIKDERWPNS